jgi:Holliday junction resolvase RusA-like endonuclease
VTSVPGDGLDGPACASPFVAPARFLWCVDVPVAPRANTRWRRAGNRIYVNPDHRAYETELAWTLKAAGVKPTSGAVGLWVEWVSPTIRRDIDSPLKTLLDGMQGIAYDNDNQIAVLCVRRYIRKNTTPFLRVRLWRML